MLTDPAEALAPMRKECPLQRFELYPQMSRICFRLVITNYLSKAHPSSLLNNGSERQKGAYLPVLTTRYFLMTDKEQLV